MAEKKPPGRPPPPSKRSKHGKDKSFSATIRFNARISGSEDEDEDVSVGFKRTEAKQTGPSPEILDSGSATRQPVALEEVSKWPSHYSHSSPSTSDSGSMENQSSRVSLPPQRNGNSAGTFDLTSPKSLSVHQNVHVGRELSSGKSTQADEQLTVESSGRDLASADAAIDTECSSPLFQDVRQSPESDMTFEQPSLPSSRASPEPFVSRELILLPDEAFLTPNDRNMSPAEGFQTPNNSSPTVGDACRSPSVTSFSSVPEEDVDFDMPKLTSPRKRGRKERPLLIFRDDHKEEIRDQVKGLRSLPAEESDGIPVHSAVVREEEILELLLPVGGGQLFRKHLFFASLLFMMLMLAPHELIRGLVIGALVMFIAGCVLVRVLVIPEKETSNVLRRTLSLPAEEKKCAEWLIPAMQPAPIIEELFSMTDTYESPATHHPSQTVKVLLKLNGSQLLISTMNESSVQWKKDESSSDDSDTEYLSHHRAKFAHSHTLNLLNSQVKLVPAELNQRQRWSKKFPIKLCLSVAEQTDLPVSVVNKVSGPSVDKEHVYFLFAVTSRDKMDWFMRLRLASNPDLPSPELASVPREHGEYTRYMVHLLPDLEPPRIDARKPKRPQKQPQRPPRPQSQARTQRTVSASSTDRAPTTADLHVSAVGGNGANTQRQSREEIVIDPKYPFGSLVWFNAALGRLFYDAWREPRWADKLKVRWQRKLSRIKTPPYVGSLVLKELNLGHCLPVARRIYQPQVDGLGMWVDVLLTYQGNFQITIETRLNLSADDVEPAVKVAARKTPRPVQRSPLGRRGRRKDSADDSSASDIDSGDDDDEGGMAAGLLATRKVPNPRQQQVSFLRRSVSGRLGHSFSKLSSLSTMAKKNVMQPVSKSTLCQRIARKLSSIPLVLNIDVQGFEGILTVNFPPPPTNVFWFGFRYRPRINLNTLPSVGSVDVHVSQLTDWIERRLKLEVMKHLLLPNMEDMVFPLMASGLAEDQVETHDVDGTAKDPPTI